MKDDDTTEERIAPAPPPPGERDEFGFTNMEGLIDAEPMSRVLDNHPAEMWALMVDRREGEAVLAVFPEENDAREMERLLVDSGISDFRLQPAGVSREEARERLFEKIQARVYVGRGSLFWVFRPDR